MKGNTHPYHFLWGAPVDEGISSVQSMVDDLARYEDHSIHYLVLSGHGITLDCGISASGGSIVADNMDSQQILDIRRKLAADCVIEMAACHQAENPAACQTLATTLQASVLATTGGVNYGNMSDGPWVMFRPSTPGTYWHPPLAPPIP